VNLEFIKVFFPSVFLSRFLLCGCPCVAAAAPMGSQSESKSRRTSATALLSTGLWMMEKLLKFLLGLPFQPSLFVDPVPN
jgi:hypothetical protein